MAVSRTGQLGGVELIPDYPVIIKHPIDLRTIETKLNAGQIETPDEFVALVRTVFRNAYVYNKPGIRRG